MTDEPLVERRRRRRRKRLVLRLHDEEFGDLVELARGHRVTVKPNCKESSHA